MTKKIALALAFAFLIATGCYASVQNSNGLEVDEYHQVIELEDDFSDDVINNHQRYTISTSLINISLVPPTQLTEHQFKLRTLSFPQLPQAPPA